LLKLLGAFSNWGEGTIIGRKAEQDQITAFVNSNIQKGKSGLLYVCGHPGQGKTALVEQVLYREYGDFDSAYGGTDPRTFVLKYNAMKFDADTFQKQLLQDFESII
jgi:hypothetical protein